MTVSNCILVDNLSPNSSDDDVAYYFENQRGYIGTVLQVRSCKHQSKYVFFRDPEGKESLLLFHLITILMMYLIIFRRYELKNLAKAIKITCCYCFKN